LSLVKAYSLHVLVDMGLQHKRLQGDVYTAIIDEFMEAVILAGLMLLPR
jgi:hypothetical protein